MPFAFYAAFLGTLGSIISLSYIAVTEHDRENPKTFSELVAAERHLLLRFRWISIVCSTLLAVTVYWYIVPRNEYGLLQSLAWSLEYFAGILMLAFPARDKFLTIHTTCAQAMAVGMLSLAYLFLPALTGAYFILGLLCALAMTLFGFAAIIDKKRFILHELAFNFISHVTICIAALGLR